MRWKNFAKIILCLVSHDRADPGDSFRTWRERVASTLDQPVSIPYWLASRATWAAQRPRAASCCGMCPVCGKIECSQHRTRSSDLRPEIIIKTNCSISTTIGPRSFRVRLCCYRCLYLQLLCARLRTGEELIWCNESVHAPTTRRSSKYNLEMCKKIQIRNTTK